MQEAYFRPNSQTSFQCHSTSNQQSTGPERPLTRYTQRRVHRHGKTDRGRLAGSFCFFSGRRRVPVVGSEMGHPPLRSRPIAPSFIGNHVLLFSFFPPKCALATSAHHPSFFSLLSLLFFSVSTLLRCPHLPFCARRSPSPTTPTIT